MFTIYSVFKMKRIEPDYLDLYWEGEKTIEALINDLQELKSQGWQFADLGTASYVSKTGVRMNDMPVLTVWKK